MSNIIILVIIGLISTIWGALQYKAGYNKELDKENSYFKFLEFLRPCINYFITLVIVYYFISVRWNYVGQGSDLNLGDFVLGFVFLVGIFGWLPYFIKYLTEGINVIATKILNK